MMTQSDVIIASKVESYCSSPLFSKTLRNKRILYADG